MIVMYRRIGIVCATLGLVGCGGSGSTPLSNPSTPTQTVIITVPLEQSESLALSPPPSSEAPQTLPEPTTPPTEAPIPTLPGGLQIDGSGEFTPGYVEAQRLTWGDCGEWHDIALLIGWPAEEWPTLSRVLYRESRCTPDAWNGHDAGLTQVNQIHREWISQMGLTFPDSMFNPVENLRFALALWEASGWRPWKATSGS